MSRKIVGVTVGTPIGISTIKKKLNPVTSVNGVEADENGNVEITIPDSGGNVAYDEAQNLTDEQKAQARENIGAADIADIPSDEHINSLINTALGVIENGTY